MWRERGCIVRMPAVSLQITMKRTIPLASKTDDWLVRETDSDNWQTRRSLDDARGKYAIVDYFLEPRPDCRHVFIVRGPKVARLKRAVWCYLLRTGNTAKWLHLQLGMNAAIRWLSERLCVALDEAEMDNHTAAKIITILFHVNCTTCRGYSMLSRCAKHANCSADNMGLWVAVARPAVRRQARSYAE
jgi:hypothetical protein